MTNTDYPRRGGEAADTAVLIEVVSAQFPTPSPGGHESDPYCIIRQAAGKPGRGGGSSGSGAVLHRTLPVRSTLSPIWTVRSNALYLLSVNEKSFRKSPGLEFEVLDGSPVIESVERALLLRGEHFYGTTTIPPEAVLGGRGERTEYALRLGGRRGASLHRSFRSWRGDNSEGDEGGGGEVACEQDDAWGETGGAGGRLALRFRPATSNDLEFMGEYSARSRKFLHGSLRAKSPDFVFKNVKPEIWGHMLKRMRGGEKEVRRALGYAW